MYTFSSLPRLASDWKDAVAIPILHCNDGNAGIQQESLARPDLIDRPRDGAVGKRALCVGSCAGKS
jgi:hypothetical protein